MAVDSVPQWIENFPGRDIPRTTTKICTVTAPALSVTAAVPCLTVDLTNRCNMMCDPCFMDANQVGFVHELSWEEIKTMLDNAITIKPRRQMSVQFSGGEPTLSPYFLDAVRYARKVGYNSVQAATNGIEFAKSLEFCAASRRSRNALRLSAIRRNRQRQRTAHRQGRQPVRREVDAPSKTCTRRAVEIVLVTTIDCFNVDRATGHFAIVKFACEFEISWFVPAGFLHRATKKSRAGRRPRQPVRSRPAGCQRRMDESSKLTSWFEPLIWPFSDSWLGTLRCHVETKPSCGCRWCGVGARCDQNRENRGGRRFWFLMCGASSLTSTRRRRVAAKFSTYAGAATFLKISSHSGAPVWLKDRRLMNFPACVIRTKLKKFDRSVDHLDDLAEPPVGICSSSGVCVSGSVQLKLLLKCTSSLYRRVKFPFCALAPNKQASIRT